MKPRLRNKLTYANVVSSLCLFLLLGGGAAFAADQLGKNSVGAKQIKKNAVTGAKIKNGAITEAKIAAGAVTASKIPDGSLTGAKLNVSTLGTVPSAERANSANTAGSAGSANSAAVAGTADSAKSLTPSEPWHVVDTPGEPAFAGSWSSIGTSYEPVSFYKDQTGTVHLKGPAGGGSGAGGETIFRLPPGFRPNPTTFLAFPVLCTCDGRLEISGFDGAVLVNNATIVHLEGISFKAES
jgi:hypothetical protein